MPSELFAQLFFCSFVALPERSPQTLSYYLSINLSFVFFLHFFIKFLSQTHAKTSPSTLSGGKQTGPNPGLHQ